MMNLATSFENLLKISQCPSLREHVKTINYEVAPGFDKAITSFGRYEHWMMAPPADAPYTIRQKVGATAVFESIVSKSYGYEDGASSMAAVSGFPKLEQIKLTNSTFSTTMRAAWDKTLLDFDRLLDYMYSPFVDSGGFIDSRKTHREVHTKGNRKLYSVLRAVCYGNAELATLSAEHISWSFFRTARNMKVDIYEKAFSHLKHLHLRIREAEFELDEPPSAAQQSRPLRGPRQA